MQKLVEEVKELVEREYGRAGATFGLFNHSDHESFAIIKEELDEAGEEFDRFSKQLGLFWASVKSDASDNKKFDQLKMMEVILHLYDRCKDLINRNMPMALLRESDVFEKIIAIKYDVPNDNLQLLDQYIIDIDAFYDRVMEKNA